VRSLLSLFFITLFFALAAFVRAAEPPLRVGMELQFPPFEMRNEKGEPAGVSVDLAHALGEQLGRAVEIQNLPFDGLIPALKTGRIDLILSSMTATPERAQSIDFSEPYLKNGLCLLVSAKSDVQGIADLDRSGRTVAVKKATTGHLYATQQFKQARVLVLDKETACVLEVAQEKADAFIYDQIGVFENWRKRPDATRPLLQSFREESWAIGLRKGSDDLRAKVNAFLADYRAKGGFDRLAEKWLAEQKAEFAKRGIPFVF
jgi:polar amino acid transport system substrate-binding protein